ncbi:MAG: amino acid adenylation domain-containing protein [Planctomycetaceae bacterium]
MNTVRPLTLFLVGESRLFLECLRIAIDRGHTISGVISSEPNITDLPRFSTLTDALTNSQARPDVLLSIVCRDILSDAVIQWPALAAVNYHNSALPAFAGVSAASAALLSDAKNHGITWHLMEPLFDAGDILVQRTFPVAADDTALSLNARCFEAACESFTQLLQCLETRQLTRTRQDLRLRSVHRFCDRLACNGLLDWSQPAEQLCRLIRASDCYPHENLIGTPAILVTAGLAGRIRSCRLLDTEPETSIPPGTILSAAANRVEISAVAGRLVLHLCPSSLTPGAKPVFEHLIPGRTLPAVTPALKQIVEVAGKASVREERKQVTRIGTLPAPLRPYGLRNGLTTRKSTTPRSLICCIPVPPQSECWLTAAQSLGRLAALSTQPKCTAALLRRNPPPSFLDFIPFEITAAATESTCQALQKASEQAWISDDLFIRWPMIRHQALAFADIQVFLTQNSHTDFDAPGLLLELRENQILVWGRTADFSSDALANLSSALTGDRHQITVDSVLPDVISMFLETVRLGPEQTCVEQNGLTYTRSQILHRARSIAAELIARGAGAESRVAVALPPSADYVAAILGALLAGAAFVPVDAAASLHRTREIIEDCRPLCVIIPADQPALTDLAPCLSVSELISLPEQPHISHQIQPDSAAYLIYTSGSTGRPKGAVIERRSIGAFIRTVIDRYELSDHDRILQLCSLAFDASIEEIFSSVCSGATLVMKPTELLESAPIFLQQINQLRLTVIGVYPAMLGSIVDVMESSQHFPETVRIVSTGGEHVPMSHVQRWRDFFAMQNRRPPALINVYGLTETTIANFHCDLSSFGDSSQPAPIGQPLPGNLCRLTSEDLCENPEHGELLIAGSQTARCYWERPGLNAARFIIEPETGLRWFRTGDLVRRLPDGNLTVLGRCDHQIKISGVRIEPEEIERCLEHTTGVKQAVVLAVTTPAGNPALFAIVCPDDPQLLASARRQIAENLPPAMQPRAILGLTELPLTDRGKVSRDQLVQHIRQSGHLETIQQSTPPDGPLAGAWQEILRQPAALDADFVQQGGDSLAAMKLLLRVEELTGVRIAVSAFLQNPTLQRLESLTVNPKVELCHKLNAGIDGLPLIFLHGITGDIAEFEGISRRMAYKGPVHAVRSRICFSTADPPASIEQFAEEAFSHIRKLHNGLPPILASWSWGGLMVWHVAHLYNQFYGIRPVQVMIDTVCPGRIPAGVIEKLRHTATYTPAAIVLKAKQVADKLRRSRPAVQTAQTVDQILKRQLQQSLIRMGDRYTPPVDPEARLHMLKATITELGPRAWSFPQRLPDNGWSYFTGCRPLIHRKRCTHTDFVWTEQANWTAECLSQICEQETIRVRHQPMFPGE